MIIYLRDERHNLLMGFYAGAITGQMIEEAHEELKEVLKTMPSGIKALVDFRETEQFAPDCSPSLGAIMDTLNSHGTVRIARIITANHQDPGMTILDAFHYPPSLKGQSCATLQDALLWLELAD